MFRSFVAPLDRSLGELFLGYAISIEQKRACYGLGAPRQSVSRVRADV